MKIYKSIVDERILHDFSKIQGRSLINHVANSYDIETAISFASLFCPEIIEVAPLLRPRTGPEALWTTYGLRRHCRQDPVAEKLQRAGGSCEQVGFGGR